MAMTTRNSNVDSKPALAWLKVCRARPMPPTRAEMPRNSNVVPMIEPVICAWTTRIFACRRMKRASISSAALPKLTLSRLPIVLPARSRKLLGGAPKPIGEHSDGGGTGEEDPAGRRIDDVAQRKG